MNTNITINTAQPGSVRKSTFKLYENEFSSGLCDCCTDFGNCCFAHFCFPCFMCKVYQNAGECFCTPIFFPNSAAFLRTKVRQGYRIKGQMWKDCFAMYFCTCCAFIQIANEIKAQGDSS
ncbi:cornifelin A -like protein [Brachionus plicatilis]|uniref:Cornifelin A-like protein n=1 Tax=Brachionus plicatilis TaxID=10195 RepID=A0A3M7SY04_BRAPC|nr:cornifelin A -like protein [Brachionus plicatilis]